MEKNISVALWVLIGILAILVLGLLSTAGLFDKMGKTGRAIQDKAETEAEIFATFAINISENMTDPGIYFNISQLPTDSKNASLNFDASDETRYYATVYYASNVNVDFCIRANDSLIEESGSGDYIGIGNYTYANHSTNDVNNPSFSDTKPLQASTTSWYDVVEDVLPGYDVYFRWWLSVPNNQNPGTYRNRIEIKGIQTGNNC